MKIGNLIRFWEIDYSKLESAEFIILIVVTIVCICSFISSIIGIKNINDLPEYKKEQAKSNEGFLILNLILSILGSIGCAILIIMIGAHYVKNRK
jgi:hypothetical protein